MIDCRNAWIRIAEPVLYLLSWFGWIMVVYAAVLLIIATCITIHDMCGLGILPHFYWNTQLRHRLEGWLIVAAILAIVAARNPKWQQIAKK